MTRNDVKLDIASMIIMDEISIDFERAQCLAEAIMSHLEQSRMSTHAADEWEKERDEKT